MQFWRKTFTWSLARCCSGPFSWWLGICLRTHCSSRRIRGFGWNDVLTQRQKLAWAIVALTAFCCVVLFAGFFAPYDFAAQDRDAPFAPPTAIRFVDASETFHLRPFVYGPGDAGTGASSAGADSEHLYPIRWFVRGAPYKIAGVFT